VGVCFTRRRFRWPFFQDWDWGLQRGIWGRSWMVEAAGCQLFVRGGHLSCRQASGARYSFACLLFQFGISRRQCQSWQRGPDDKEPLSLRTYPLIVHRPSTHAEIVTGWHSIDTKIPRYHRHSPTQLSPRPNTPRTTRAIRGRIHPSSPYHSGKPTSANNRLKLKAAQGGDSLRSVPTLTSTVGWIGTSQ